MIYAFAVLCIILMVLCLFTLFVGLPGIWGIIALVVLWALLGSSSAFSWSFFAFIIGLGALGELVEFAAQYYGAKKYGGTGKGSLGGMIGAVAGGIFFAPFLFGIGALLGALGGGYAGCYITENLRGMPPKEAHQAAMGCTIGRFSGFIVKMGVGIAIIWLSVPKIWP